MQLQSSIRIYMSQYDTYKPVTEKKLIEKYICYNTHIYNTIGSELMWLSKVVQYRPCNALGKIEAWQGI